MNEEKIVFKITFTGVFGNIMLTAFKLFAGIYGKSGAMISDAIHSLSDVIATFIAFVGLRLSKQPADREHPYGHERVECVASLCLGVILILTGLGMGKSGLEKIFAGSYDTLTVPGRIAALAAIVSIVAKEVMFHYTMHYAKIIDSPVFKADAWHHRSDALSSVCSLVGIVFALCGFPVMDPVASVIICVFILKVSYDILKDAIAKMLDTSCGQEFDKEIADLVSSQEGVKAVDVVQSRMFGSKVYVDLEIEVDRNLTVGEGHEIAERVHDLLEKERPNIKHVMVHVNPTPL